MQTYMQSDAHLGKVDPAKDLSQLLTNESQE
jgi:hypothetical protein